MRAATRFGRQYLYVRPATTGSRPGFVNGVMARPAWASAWTLSRLARLRRRVRLNELVDLVASDSAGR